MCGSNRFWIAIPQHGSTNFLKIWHLSFLHHSHRISCLRNQCSNCATASGPKCRWCMPQRSFPRKQHLSRSKGDQDGVRWFAITLVFLTSTDDLRWPLCCLLRWSATQHGRKIGRSLNMFRSICSWMRPQLDFGSWRLTFSLPLRVKPTRLRGTLLRGLPLKNVELPLRLSEDRRRARRTDSFLQHNKINSKPLIGYAMHTLPL